MLLKGSFIFYLASMLSLSQLSSSKPWDGGLLQNYQAFYSGLPWTPPSSSQQLAMPRSPAVRTTSATVVAQKPIVQQQQQQQLQPFLPTAATATVAQVTPKPANAKAPTPAIETRSNSLSSHLVQHPAGGNGTSGDRSGSLRQDSLDSISTPNNITETETATATTTASSNNSMNVPSPNLSAYLGSEVSNMLTTAVAFLGAALGRGKCDLKAACLAGTLLPQTQGRDMVILAAEAIVPKEWKEVYAIAKKSMFQTLDCNKYECF